MPQLTQALLQQALSGDRRAQGDVVGAMVPIIHRRVARILTCVGTRQGRDPRQELEDFVQDVLVALFDKDGHALRRWTPQGGLSLENWIGLLTEHKVVSTLKSRKHNPWTDEPTEVHELDSPVDSERDAERLLASREHLNLILERTEARLTPLGRLMFQWLVIEDRSVEEICNLAKMTHAQVYNWKSRLVALLLKVAEEGMVEMDQNERTPQGRSD